MGRPDNPLKTKQAAESTTCCEGFPLVEMAGIEPASEKFDLRMSTSLVDLLCFVVGRPGQLGQPAHYPIAPERASLAAPIGISAEHVGIDVARSCPTDEWAKANGFLV